MEISELSRIHDSITPVRGIAHEDRAGIRGTCRARLYGPDGKLKLERVVSNLVTQVGDQYYAERAAAITSPPAQVTGMQLGSGTTGVAKTGGGAAVVTYITSSAVAIDGGYPTSGLSGSSRRITWQTTWAAGVATASGIAEVVIINQSVGTNSGAAAAATISRALFSSAFDKAALDSLVVTWTHDLLGA